MNRSLMLALFGALITGCLLIWQAAHWRGSVEDEKLRSNLLRQAEAIARSVDPNSVKALSFSPIDKDNPEFQRLRGHMIAYGEILNVRGLYSMAKRNGLIIFGPENYGENDPQASSPGSIHEQPSENVNLIFKTGRPFVEGPTTDEYGTFVSAVAPVLDPRTGEPLMIIGLDIEAQDWEKQIHEVRLKAIIYGSAMLSVFLVLIALVFLKRREEKLRGPLIYAEAYLVACTGIFGAIIFGAALHDNETVNRREVFALMADAHSTSLQQGFNHLSNHQVGSITRLIEGSDQIDKNEFLLNASPLIEQGGVRFAQWIPRIPAAEKEMLERTSKIRISPSFFIWFQGNDGFKIPAFGQAYYYPIFYMSPLVGQESFLGFDINSEPDIRVALEKSLASGLPVCAGPTVLPPDPKHQSDLMVLSPAFLVTGENRPILGFVLAAVSPQNFLRFSLPSLGMTEAPPAVIQMYQLESGQAPRMLASSAPLDQYEHSLKDFMGLDYGKTFLVYPGFFLDQTFAVVVHLGPKFLTDHPELVWKVTFSIGLLLTLAMTAFTVLLIRGRRDLEMKVLERTTRLSESEARLARLNQCLLDLETDNNANILSLTTCCGELLKADSATYYRIEDGVVFSTGKYTLPIGFKPADHEGNHVYRDVIKNESGFLLTRESQNSPWEKNPDEVNSLVKTYMAAVAHRNGKPVGSICVLFDGFKNPSNDDRHIIQIVASAIGGEEDRARALDQLQRRQAFEHELLDVSGRFINVSTAEIDALIEESLKQVGSFCNADRSYVFIFDAQRQTMSNTHEWSGEGTRPEKDNLQDVPFAELPAFMESLRALEIVHIPDVSKLTDAWEKEKKHLEAQGILSLVVAPLEQSGRLIGFVGFDSVKGRHEWETWQYTMLRVFSDRLSGALERKRVEEERNKLEAQLFQAQKLESIGTLAGGIAHDFNNLLQIIQGFAEVLLMKKKETEPDYKALLAIFHAAQSGADLVQRILLFSRKTNIKPGPLDLNDQVEHAVELLSRTIPKSIDVHEHLAENLAMVSADAIQIEQVLMNLALNAVDAMPDGGRLSIETRNIVLDQTTQETISDGTQVGMVELIISDTGHGMDTETLKHIFEPFFTTKGVGRGTGLGLSVVYGIVKQHGGEITCESYMGKGTSFKICLPVARPQGETSPPIDGSATCGGTETILLVDDEDEVRNYGRMMLEDCGYKVLTAINGRDAIEIYKREINRISLVILDLIMPELDGRQCIRELLRINPDLRVLIQSGVASGSAAVKSLDMGARGFVRKPYRANDFLQAVSQILKED